MTKQFAAPLLYATILMFSVVASGTPARDGSLSVSKTLDAGQHSVPMPSIPRPWEKTLDPTQQSVPMPSIPRPWE
jgi:hypothetical protein